MPTRAAKPRSKVLAGKMPAVVDHDQHSRVAQVVLVIATLATLWPVCTNEFTTWDDYLNVVKNGWLNPVTLGGVLHFWAHPFEGLYIPLTYTVWGGLASIARISPDPEGITLNPYVFHSANLLLHVAGVICLFHLLRLLTTRTWAAAAGALLFAIHPIQVEPVAWVTGMKDVLSGALSIFALWQYVLFARPAGLGAATQTERVRAVHYWAAMIGFILAMLSKPSAITVLPAAVVLDRFFLRRQWRQITKALAPWLTLALACAVLARITQPVVNLPDEGRVWARPFFAGAAFAFYLYKLVWPARLAVVYHYSPAVLLAGRWIWFAWIVPAAVAVLLWMFRKKWPWLPGCVALSLVAILPVSGLTPFAFEKYSLVADRYLYFAMIGPALALAYALSSTRRLKPAAILCAIGLLSLGIRANFQIAHWRDTSTLFTHELAVNPASAEAYASLSAQAMAHHDLQSAERLARESIRLQPERADAYLALASALVAQGRKSEATSLLLYLREHDPDHPALLSDLAGLLAAQAHHDPRKLAEAEQLCRRALEISPFLAMAHNNLALILADQGRFDQALSEAQKSVQLDPGDVNGQVTLAALLEHEHQHGLATQHAMQAVQLEPGNLQARQLLDTLTRQPH